MPQVIENRRQEWWRYDVTNMITGETRVRVRYAETDQMGVVYHSNYFIWMECGRVELCRGRGVRYRDMEEDGVVLAVAEATCRFRAPARYDDQVVIQTSIVSARSKLVRFRYSMRSEESGRLLATGESVHVFVDREMNPARLPEKYFPLFGIER